MLKKAPLTERRTARKTAEQTKRSSQLGSGSTFKAVARSAKASGAPSPAAVAASAGQKKYGTKKMTGLSRAGH